MSAGMLAGALVLVAGGGTASAITVNYACSAYDAANVALATGIVLPIDITASAAASAEPNTEITITVPARSQPVPASVEVNATPYDVAYVEDLVYRLTVVGGTIVAGSALKTNPAAVGSVAVNTTQNWFQMTYPLSAGRVNGGQSVQWPAATFKVLTGASGTTVRTTTRSNLVEVDHLFTVAVLSGAVVARVKCTSPFNTVSSTAVGSGTTTTTAAPTTTTTLAPTTTTTLAPTTTTTLAPTTTTTLAPTTTTTTHDHGTTTTTVAPPPTTTTTQPPATTTTTQPPATTTTTQPPATTTTTQPPATTTTTQPSTTTTTIVTGQDTTGPLFPSADEVEPCATLGLVGDGFAAGAAVEVTLSPDPVALDFLAADGDGAISGDVTIPCDTAPGDYTVEATGDNPGGGTHRLSAVLTVSDDDTSTTTAAITPQSTHTGGGGTGGTGGTGGGGSLPRTGGDSLPLGLAGFVALVTGLTVLGALRMRETQTRRI